MTKEEWHERGKQETYGVLIFLFWMGVVLLVQYFVPGGVLFIKVSWYWFGAFGFVWMVGTILKAKNFKPSDIILLFGMIILGPVGVLGYFSWLTLAKIQRKRVTNGKAPQST